MSRTSLSRMLADEINSTDPDNPPDMNHAMAILLVAMTKLMDKRLETYHLWLSEKEGNYGSRSHPL